MIKRKVKQDKNVKVLNPSKDIIITEDQRDLLVRVIEQDYSWKCGCSDCNALIKLKKELEDGIESKG